MITVRDIRRRPMFFIGDRIRKARMAVGYTCAELASLTGMSAHVIDLIEDGGEPTEEEIVAIAQATGVDLDWLQEDRPQ